jgi:uncharacterized protein (DUF58 family)
MVAALATGRPELALLAAPFLVLAGAGLFLAGEPRLTAEIELERTRLLEGEAVAAAVRLRNTAAGAIQVELAPARTRQLALEPAGPLAVRVPANGETEVTFAVRPDRWGAHAVGPLLVRVRDPLGVAIWDGSVGARVDLRVFPREQRVRELVAPLRTQPFLADVRPFQLGDRVRHVNWRATARRGVLQVNERHPEHSSDVVLLLDTFAEARDQTSGTLDSAVRAAAALARAHLDRRDRVGVVDFGGTLHWLEPAFGANQLYRIIDALLTSDIAFSYAWRDVEGIPRRVLPPGALILAITPLLDERSIALVSELARRGSDLTVVEISPLDHVAPGPSAADGLAYRLWRLEREALRARLQALGIGVAVWERDTSVGPALEEVNAFRRSARHALPA